MLALKSTPKQASSTYFLLPLNKWTFYINYFVVFKILRNHIFIWIQKQNTIQFLPLIQDQRNAKKFQWDNKREWVFNCLQLWPTCVCGPVCSPYCFISHVHTCKKLTFTLSQLSKFFLLKSKRTLLVSLVSVPYWFLLRLPN